MSDIVSPMAAPPIGATASDWISLLKPRVMTLVVFTGAIGLVIAPERINPVLGLAAILCIAIAAGAAGAINMWYDRDIDALMARTAKRPIPGGRIEANAVLAFGVVLAVLSVMTMAMATNLVAAGLLAASIGFYVFIYTMGLKRRTAQNIVIGGAAGAFPPLIGWAAATGSIGMLPALLFAIVFFWTPPHFWSLSLYACRDYTRAGVPMLPVVAGPRHTRRAIFAYTIVLVAVSLAPLAFHLAGRLYAGATIALDAGFLWHAFRVLTDRQDAAGASLTGDAPARAAFRYSLLYLALLFTACAVDHLVVAWRLVG
jgi:heme o synthase